jgi:hypothetical protein
MAQIIHANHESRGEPEPYKDPVCVKCSNKLGRVVRMYVKNNGVFIPYGRDAAQVGDLLVCPVCHVEIIQGFSEILRKSVADQVLESEYAILKGVQDIPL